MSETMLPIIILPLTFLFVLLIILIAKSPKAGAWVVGGLLLLAPVLLLGFARAGAFSHEEAIPLFVMPVMFLFVLLVILLAKAPKIGIGLVIGFVVLVVFGLVFGVFAFMHTAHRTVAYYDGAQTYPIAEVRQQTQSNAAVAIVGDPEKIYEGFVNQPHVSPTPSEPLAPIWSEGVEQEFEADVYPSKLVAVQAIGRQIEKTVRELIPDANSPVQITLFQEVSDPVLMSHLRILIQQVMPQAACAIEVDLRDLRPNEVGATLMLSGMDMQPAPWSGETRIASGTVDVHVFTAGRRAMIETQFVETPWIDNFGTFSSARPDQQYVIARSNGSCMSEAEAHQQALVDAAARLTEAMGRQTGRGLADLGRRPISTTDVLNGNFVVDRFMQSFDTSTGKVWRQALLLDVSGPRLAQLSRMKVVESGEVRETWARMGLSVVGVLALISVIYFFLNMATRGYYEWSLRIAGVILAVVAIVSILMIVH